MKIILLYVTSLDGKITKWGQPPFQWTSIEDHQHLLQTIQDNNLIVITSSIYTSIKPTPTPNTLRIIMTRKPQKYASITIPGQIEFSNESPAALVSRLEKKGYSQMLLLTGPTVTTKFFKQNLINELWLTIEPRIFGTGRNIVAQEQMDITLELFETKQLNKTGTLLLKYKINNR